MAHLAENPVGDKIISGWPHDDQIKNLINVNEENDGAYNYSQNCPNDMPTQGLKMINEAHLRFLFPSGS
jgi:hypothetical protein